MASADTTSPRTTKARKTTAAAKRATATKRTTTPAAKSSVAERAVLIPVGAVLIARDKVVSGVNDTITSYSSTSRAQAQLRKFERRGSTARNRLEREVRKARVRVERELRQRRRDLEQTVSTLEERRDAVAKNVTELPNRVQERILSIV